MVCPILRLKAYLGVSPPKEGPLFVHLNGKAVTRYQFQAVLKKAVAYLGWQTTGFSTHSFRIGAATTAAANGTPQAVIMRLGRWKSAAMGSYIRLWLLM